MRTIYKIWEHSVILNKGSGYLMIYVSFSFLFMNASLMYKPYVKYLKMCELMGDNTV